MENSVAELNREFIRLIIRNIRMEDNQEVVAKMYQKLNDLPSDVIELRFPVIHAVYVNFIEDRNNMQKNILEILDSKNDSKN